MYPDLIQEYFWEAAGTTILLTFLTIYLYLTWTFDYWKKQGVPGNKPRPFLGTIKSLENVTLHDYDYANHKKYGRVYGGFEGRLPVLHISDPEMIKQAFVKDASIFMDRRSMKMFENTPVIGKALTFLKGEEWKRTRAILTPTFSCEKLKQMFSLVVDCSNTFTQSLEKYADNNEVINAQKLFSSFTLDVIANCAFGIKTDSIAKPENEFKAAAENIMNDSAAKLSIVFPQLYTLCSWFARPFVKNPFKFLKETAEKSIDTRKTIEQKAQRKDFLDLLLQAEANEDVTTSSQNIGNKILTRDVMVAQCVQFLLAAHETTATTFAMLAYCLALNPAVQERLISEIDEATAENKGTIEPDKIGELQYMDMVLCETLRLYGPIVRLERTCSENEYNLHGVILDKDTLVTVSPFSIHRDQQFYPDPEKFDPERFSSENKEKRNPYTYLPFGVGPRMCVAMRFAMLQVKLVISQVLSNFRFQASSQTEIPMSFKSNRFNLLTPFNVTLAIQKRIDKNML